MRIFIAALILTAAMPVMASQYECHSNFGPATLIVDSVKSIHWTEPHEAASFGLNEGLEEAPYSSQLGFVKFRLTDFYSNLDSANYVALSSLSGSRISAVRYFDNDGHDEDSTQYICTLR